MADLKARIDAGEIGDVVVIHQTSRWSIAEDGTRSGKPGWFADPRHVPGGALIDEGIYWIDLFRWLAGSESCRSRRRSRNFVHKDIEVEDWGMATFTFASGVIAHARSRRGRSTRRGRPAPRRSRTAVVPAGSGRHARRDHRSVVSIAGARRARRRRGRLGVRAAVRNMPLATASPFPLTHLIDCLEEKRQPDATIQEARKCLPRLRWRRTSRRRQGSRPIECCRVLTRSGSA